MAQVADPEARVWKGSGLPTTEQGIRVLGTPLGHVDYVETQLRDRLEDHQVLLNRIPEVQDLQAVWALLLHCASARANFMLRVIRPELVRGYAEGHDRGIWTCLCKLLGRSCELASVPLSLGGLGLRSATRTREAAYWASWADCLFMVRKRHPVVADRILDALNNMDDVESTRSAAVAAHHLSGVEGFEVPSWEALSHGLRPRPHDPEDREPGGFQHGWQHEAASRVERHFRDRNLMTRLAEHEMALLRSQSGPYAGMALSVAPASFLTRIAPALFRVLLLRRLRLPLPLSFRLCRCGRPLDSFGHHRAACSRAGVLGRRGFAVESAAARICREAGGRVTLNMMVRDMDLAVPHAHDTRRLEIVADGLPLFGGTQLAIDTTLVSTLHCDGSARRGAAHRDGVALVTARRKKERTYPELIGPHARARLVVLAGEVGGRWSDETRSFLCQLARAKARSEPSILRGRAEQAWRLRWASTLACSAARAFAASLLNLRVGGGVDGDVPRTHEVVNEFRHAGLE